MSSLLSLQDLAARLLAGLPGPKIQAAEGGPAMPNLYRALEARLRAGREDQIAVALHALIAHKACPPWPIVMLAHLAMRQRKWEEAAATWEACLQRFPAQTTPPWLFALHECRIAEGAHGKAASVISRLRDAYPRAQETLLLDARAALAVADWRQAFRGFAAYLHEAPQPRPEAFLGLAETSWQLGRPRVALATWQAGISRFPGELGMYQALISGAVELGQWEVVAAQSARRLERFPTKAQPDWYAVEIRALWRLRRDAKAEEALAAFTARFPDSSKIALLTLENASRRFVGSADMYALSLAASRRFPKDRAVQAIHVASLAARGALQKAQALANELAASGDDEHSLIARWTVAIARGGRTAIRAEAEALAPQLQLQRELRPTLAVADFLLKQWCPWSVALAAEVLRALDARLPGRPQVRICLARALVTVRQDAEAASLLQRVPALYQTFEVLELRAWAAARQNRLSEARAIWDALLNQQYFPALHAPEPRLDLVRAAANAAEQDGVAAFLVLRNELTQLPALLAHHRRLGVRRFFAVDNMSDDGGFEYLLTQSDVTLYRTADSFRQAGSGVRWRRALIERHAPQGWCLVLDADEAFIFPGWEEIGIDGLIAYLESRGQEGVAAFMLDMFPARLFGPHGEAAVRADSVYFDTDYCWLEQLRAPYRQPVGGVRARLFDTMEYLHKLPFYRADRALSLNNHETTPLRLAEVSGALLHYKLHGLAAAQGSAAAAGERAVQVMQRYRRYEQVTHALHDTDLRALGISRRLKGSWELVDAGLLQVSEAYRAWYAAHG